MNQAAFSPSGRQILTTCQDNRLRLWSNLLACDGPPTREIVHSHDFNRSVVPWRVRGPHTLGVQGVSAVHVQYH